MAHNWYDKSPMWPQFNHGCPEPVPPDAEPYNAPYAVLGYTEAGQYVFTIHTVDGDTYDVEAGNNIIILGDTTYKLEASEDGKSLTLVGSDGSTSTVPMYSAVATSESAGLMSAEDKAKLDGIEENAGKTGVFGIKSPTETTYTQSGNYDITKEKLGLGNVENKSASDILDELTAQDITAALGYTPADSASAPSGGVTGVKGDAEQSYREGNVNITKENIGLGNVQNVGPSAILQSLTYQNIVDALGYVPLDSTDAPSASRVKYVQHEIEIVTHGNYVTNNIPLSNIGITDLYSDDCVTVSAVPHYFSGIQINDITCLYSINDSTMSLSYRVDNNSDTNTIVHVIITVYEADSTHDGRT